jgi:signal transduction histidine kinase/CheY-like chemotaxis protein
MNFSYIYNFLQQEYTVANLEDLQKANLLPTKLDDDYKLNFAKFIANTDLERYLKFLHDIKNKTGNYSISYSLKKIDGGLLPVTDYISVVKEEGKWPVLIGSIVVDAPVVTSMEGERQVLLGRLVSGMVHDFKNLLTGIQNILEWAVVKTSDDKEVSQALFKTVKYTEEANNLIIGTLQLSTNEKSSDAGFEMETFDIRTLIMDFKDLLRRILPNSAELIIDFKNDIPLLKGRKRLLQDLILNLCMNARDAMQEQGEVLKILVSFESLENLIILQIKDSGCGMHSDDIEEVFNAFYSTKEHGAGLGLWMVKEAINSFNGKLKVTSELGEGTTFEIAIPVDAPEFVNHDYVEECHDEVKQLVKQHDIDFNGKKVLLVEDEPLIRSGVSAWLESWGIDVIPAEDGIIGEELFRQHEYELDLVIQDFILPGRRGDELIKVFRNVNPNVPIILTSANPEKEELANLGSIGATAFIEKPFKMDKLQLLLSKLL